MSKSQSRIFSWLQYFPYTVYVRKVKNESPPPFYFPNIYYVKKVLQSWKNLTLRIWLTNTFRGLLDSFMLFLWLCAVCVRVNTIASKRCIRLRSNLGWVLLVTIEQTLLILMTVGCIVFFFFFFFQEYKEEFLYITTYGFNFFKGF